VLEVDLSGLPIDTTSTFQESQLATKKIIAKFFCIENLSMISFISLNGKIIKIDSSKPIKYRPEDIHFYVSSATLMEGILTHRSPRLGIVSSSFVCAY
jgi:hypothetical protein